MLDSYKYFILDENGDIQDEKQLLIPRINTILTANGKKSIFNSSLVETLSGNPTYKWIYQDNSSSFGLIPNRELNIDEPVQLEIDNGNGTILASPNDWWGCSMSGFNVTVLSDGSVKLELPGLANTPQATIKWILSDGTISNENPFITTKIKDGSKVTCQLLYKGTNEVACQATKTISLKCGDKGSISRSDLLSNGGSTWKLDCELWVKNNEVGCSMKYLKRSVVLGVEVFLPAKSGGVSQTFSGTYIREKIVSNGKTCTPIFGSGSKGYGSGTWPTSFSVTVSDPANIFRDPSKLSSTHSLSINGVPMGPGVTLPKLVLN